MANTFLGKAIIAFKVRGTTAAPINQVVLHANDLQIEDYQTTLTGVLPFVESAWNSTNDKWTVDIGAPITADVNVTLTVNYRGFMRDDMAGFYKSYYYENGAKVWMASTQFQPSDARRAFPCFDVNHFLVTFQWY